MKELSKARNRNQDYVAMNNFFRNCKPVQKLGIHRPYDFGNPNQNFLLCSRNPATEHEMVR